MNQTEPSDLATLVGGLLSATGDLRADITTQDVRVAVGRLLQPSTLWYATTETVVEPPADWVAPDAAVVTQASDALVRGWHEDTVVRRTVGVLPPVLRLMMRNISDVEALLGITTVDDDIAVTSFIPAVLGNWRWRWPLRVGVGRSAESKSIKVIHGDHGQGGQYEIRSVTETSEPLDVLIISVDDDLPAEITSVGVVIVLGRTAERDRAPLADQIARGEEIDAGAVVAVPGNDVDWFGDFVHELSQNRPLDAAMGIVRPDAVVEADPNFLATTALRNWTRLIADNAADSGDLDLSYALRPISESYAFDGTSARAAREAVSAAEVDGVTREIRGGGGGIGAPSGPETPGDTDDRHLVARVTGPDNSARVDYFLAGRQHRIALRIARPGAEDEVDANWPIPSPAVGSTVDLDVVVAIEDSRAPAQRVKVTYPAHGDGPLSEAVTFRAPRRKSQLSIFITALWKGRAIQSAKLTGVVVADGAVPTDARMTLNVDVSSAPPDRVRQGADMTFIEIVEQGAKPVVFDASSGMAIESIRCNNAVADVRRQLISAVQRPASSLGAAAPALAQLAMHGVALRRALFYGNDVRFADASWIHVTSFGMANIPFEIIYDHEFPDTDNKKVSICGRALAGKRSCAADCRDRSRDDRVCPFGFWGTSKIVERRVHSSDRRDVSVSDQRLVPVRKGGVVGVTQQANKLDKNASTRIADAVSGFVDAGTSTFVEGWSGLEKAVVTPRNLLCLVTHTIPGQHPGDFETKLELGVELRKLMLVGAKFINPGNRQPGPVVLALGCDTESIDASFATFVAQLHSVGAEIVVSAIAQIPGKEVADFVVRLMRILAEELALTGQHRFGAVLTAARRETLCKGDLLALALTASGDGDVQIGDQ
jgi:hypothetical protein